MLNKHGINKDLIYIFVDECEIDEYSNCLNHNHYNQIIKGGKGILKQVEAVEAFFPIGTHILRIDDDIDEIIFDTSGFLGIPLDDFIKLAFSVCIENKAFIWGLYPVNNQFFMLNNPEINFNLSYICGNFYGFINRNIDELKLTTTVKTNGNKEDVERTLRYWTCDGIIVRFDRITTKTKYYGTDGGGLGRFNDRLEPMKKATINLLSEFNEFGSLYTKSCGMTEFKFKKTPNIWGVENIFSYYKDE